jgi:hypothetical protein
MAPRRRAFDRGRDPKRHGDEGAARARISRHRAFAVRAKARRDGSGLPLGALAAGALQFRFCSPEALFGHANLMLIA